MSGMSACGRKRNGDASCPSLLSLPRLPVPPAQRLLTWEACCVMRCTLGRQPLFAPPITDVTFSIASFPREGIETVGRRQVGKKKKTAVWPRKERDWPLVAPGRLSQDEGQWPASEVCRRKLGWRCGGPDVRNAPALGRETR